MEWRDTGFVLTARRHGESALIVELLTREHGRHAGLVRGGQSPRRRALLQPGNQVAAAWRGRLPEHLGSFECELVEAHAARFLDDPDRLAALTAAASLLLAALPEREPNAELYEAFAALLDALDSASSWPRYYVAWECGLLAALGFGLDLERCTLAGEIRDVDFADALGERYLSYALSTIMARSLPDVRDGLKPVHRRILHAMDQLRLDPASGYKKCARVVGDVIGKYHPHGELAVYDALVRLAQDFSQRYPLVDGQGNFGNIDGDNAAAMRYTESRLSAVAQAMLDGIDADVVDFRPTYDGEDSEPVILPARFPNLLANGSSGIAVGMATSIPT